MAQRAAEKMATYRTRQRARGLRSVQMWVPDFDNPEFRARLRRSADLLRDHPSTREAEELRDALMGEVFAGLDRSETGDV